MTRVRRTFSKEFKEQVVSLVVDAKQSYTEVSKVHELAPNLIRKWVKEASKPQEDCDSEDASYMKNLKSLQQQINDLRKQLAEEKKVNEFLKKTLAFFANQPN